MKKLIAGLLLFASLGFAQVNQLNSPSDLTNASWSLSGTGCTHTGKNAITSVANVCGLLQVVPVATNTVYTVSVSVALNSGTAQVVNLSLSTTGFSPLCNRNVTITATPQLLSCSASTASNTSLQFEIDTNGSVASTISLANPVLGVAAVQQPISAVQFCGTTTTCSHTSQGVVQEVYGSAPLVTGSPSTAVVTGISPAFTSTSTFVCTVTNQTTQANPVKVVNTSSSSITITGPNSVTDVVGYHCLGT